VASSWFFILQLSQNECYRLPTLLPYSITGLLIMYQFLLQSSAETPRFMLCQYHEKGGQVDIQIIYTHFF